MEPIKDESQKCRAEIEEFVDDLKSFLNNLKQSSIYVYSTGAYEASRALLKI